MGKQFSKLIVTYFKYLPRNMFHMKLLFIRYLLINVTWKVCYLQIFNIYDRNREYLFFLKIQYRLEILNVYSLQIFIYRQYQAFVN